MIDGVHFADHLCVVALGIGIDGTKHPLGVVEFLTNSPSLVSARSVKGAGVFDLRHPLGAAIGRDSRAGEV